MGPASADEFNKWIDPAGISLMGGLIRTDMAFLDVDSARSMVLHCSLTSLQELRHLCQHELSCRNLFLSCAQHNALLLDPTLRQRERADVALVGPPLKLMEDMCAVVSNKLSSTTWLASHIGSSTEIMASSASPRKKAEVAHTDVSRHATGLQNPWHHIEKVRVVLGQLYARKMEELRVQGFGLAEAERRTRELRYRLLTCNALGILDVTSDLSVRVQAAYAVGGLRKLAALFPGKITPFERFVERKRHMVDKDGSVGSLFCLPTMSDVLLLRGTKQDPRPSETMG